MPIDTAGGGLTVTDFAADVDWQPFLSVMVTVLLVDVLTVIDLVVSADDHK